MADPNSDQDFELECQLGELNATLLIENGELILSDESLPNLKQIVQLAAPHALKLQILDSTGAWRDRHIEQCVGLTSVRRLDWRLATNLTDLAIHYLTQWKLLEELILDSWQSRKITSVELKLFARM